MKPAWLARVPAAWRAQMVRLGFNFHPAFRGTGARVVFVSPDLRHIRVSLPLTWKTRNIVGSLYGGSLFAMTDGAHPMMLMAALGDGYIIWDKAATIRYKKPGTTTLTADFVLEDAELATIRQALAQNHELERTYTVALKDHAGTVYTLVERTVYIAEKNFYRQKTAAECDEQGVVPPRAGGKDHEQILAQ
jgi:acyl-coenzyme A thioesterase PaaI-like protein